MHNFDDNLEGRVQHRNQPWERELNDQPADWDPKLASQLKEALTPPPLDETNDAAFRAELRSIKPEPKTLAFPKPALLALAGLAAALLIGLMVLPNLLGDPSTSFVATAKSSEDKIGDNPTEFAISQAAAPASRPADINTDGAIDIADAYFLATHLENSPSPNPSYDFDGDGAVDQNDLDELTTLIVAL